jgi:hypothetical protein
MNHYGEVHDDAFLSNTTNTTIALYLRNSLYAECAIISPANGMYDRWSAGDEALVSSAIVIFEKAPPAGQDIDFTLGGSLRCPSERVTIPHADLIPGYKWTKYSRGGRFSIGRSRPREDSRHPLLLGDIFTIKRGLATGNNDFFILPRAKARKVGIPDQFLRPILPSRAKIWRDVPAPKRAPSLSEAPYSFTPSKNLPRMICGAAMQPLPTHCRGRPPTSSWTGWPAGQQSAHSARQRL